MGLDLLKFGIGALLIPLLIIWTLGAFVVFGYGYVRFTIWFWHNPKGTMHSIRSLGSEAGFLAIVFTFLAIEGLGLGYRGLRLLSDYQYDEVHIRNCERERQWPSGSVPTFSFEVYTDGLSYPIKRTEAARFGSKGWEPVKDWCEIGDSNITVYHFDKLKVAIPYDSGIMDVSVWVMFMTVTKEQWSTWSNIVLVLLFVAWLIVGSLKYFIYALSTLDFMVRRGESETTFTYYQRSINHVLSLLVTGALAGGYVTGLGAALLNGMLYVESDSNFLTGLSVLIGLVLILFAPIPICKGVHLLRTARNKSFALIRNLALLVAASIPAYNIWSFVIREDLSHSPLGSIWDLLMQLASATVS